LMDLLWRKRRRAATFQNLQLRSISTGD